MSDEELRARALRVEEMLPKLMRTLYRAQESDPIQHLPVAQVRVLRVLFNSPKSHSAVSEELGTTVSAITQVANRLELLGLVERVESSSDRRVKNLRLTEHGAKCMRDRQEYRVMRTMEALERIPAHRQEALIEVLEELIRGGLSINHQRENQVLAVELAQLGRFPVMGGEGNA